MRYVDLVRSQGEDPGHLWGDPRGDSAVWAAHNPYDLVSRLRGTQLFVAVGNGQPGPLDPAGTAASTVESSLAPENAPLPQRFGALKIPAHCDLFAPGTHHRPSGRRDRHHAWPLRHHAH